VLIALTQGRVIAVGVLIYFVVMHVLVGESLTDHPVGTPRG
jgi:hypothetical protein